MIYLDHAATTPLSPEAWAAMEPILRNLYANPSSMHQAGRLARNELTRVRESLARNLAASTRDLYFTSGATEANNWAIRAAAALAAGRGLRHLLTTRIEHPSVLAVFEALAAEGFDVDYLEANASGLVSPDELRRAIREDTGFVSCHYVNNETGSVQDIEKMGLLCRERGILFHTDAVQAIARKRIDWRSFPADFLVFSAHKFGGPKGTGALLTRSERGSAIELAPLLLGGRQERGRRAGTENLAGIVGMAAALDAVYATCEEDEKRYRDLSARLLSVLDERGLCYRRHGADEKSGRQLASILNLYFPGCEGQTLLLLLDRSGLAVSLGSACEAGSSEASHVLLALGCGEEEASSSIRISMGKGTTAEEIDEAGRIIAKSVELLLNRS